MLLYLESFGNPRKFARLARVLGKTKPVIAVKSGRHARTTAGLAGNRLDDAVVGTLFEQSGVIRTPGLTDAFDVAQLLSTQPVPAGNRVGIVGNSKALGVLAVDFCLDAGLQVTDDAPTDLGVTVSAEAFGAAVHQAIARPDVDALVVAWVPPVAIPGTAHAAALRDAVADASKAGRHHLPGRRRPGRSPGGPRQRRAPGAWFGPRIRHIGAGGLGVVPRGQIRGVVVPSCWGGSCVDRGRPVGRAGGSGPACGTRATRNAHSPTPNW